MKVEFHLTLHTPHGYWLLGQKMCCADGLANWFVLPHPLPEEIWVVFTKRSSSHSYQYRPISDSAIHLIDSNHHTRFVGVYTRTYWRLQELYSQGYGHIRVEY